MNLSFLYDTKTSGAHGFFCGCPSSSLMNNGRLPLKYRSNQRKTTNINESGRNEKPAKVATVAGLNAR
jgi:hypothetical protein